MFCNTGGWGVKSHLMPPFVKVIRHWYIYRVNPVVGLTRFVSMWSGNSRYWLFQAIGWGGFALISVFFAYSFDQLV